MAEIVNQKENNNQIQKVIIESIDFFTKYARKPVINSENEEERELAIKFNNSLQQIPESHAKTILRMFNTKKSIDKTASEYIKNMLKKKLRKRGISKVGEQNLKKTINTKTVDAPHRTKVDYYEYEKPQYEAYISEKRKREIIEKLKRNIEKKDSTIVHYKILDIAKDNDDELDFIYTWLINNNIEIRELNRNYARRNIKFQTTNRVIHTRFARGINKGRRN